MYLIHILYSVEHEFFSEENKIDLTLYIIQLGCGLEKKIKSIGTYAGIIYVYLPIYRAKKYKYSAAYIRNKHKIARYSKYCTYMYT